MDRLVLTKLLCGALHRQRVSPSLLLNCVICSELSGYLSVFNLVKVGVIDYCVEYELYCVSS